MLSFLMIAILGCLLLSKSIYAYLIDTETIVNTFVVGNLVDVFVLKEHEILDANKDGAYELGSNEVLGNVYTVYPEIDIPKDPFIRLSNLNDEAYLYVEVVGEKSSDFYWSFNNNWLETNLAGKNGGTVYAYKGNSLEVVALNETTGKDFMVYILSGIDGSENGGIEVSKNFSADNSIELKFYGYLAQAQGFKDYLEAYEECF